MVRIRGRVRVRVWVRARASVGVQSPGRRIPRDLQQGRKGRYLGNTSGSAAGGISREHLWVCGGQRGVTPSRRVERRHEEALAHLARREGHTQCGGPHTVWRGVVRRAVVRRGTVRRVAHSAEGRGAWGHGGQLRLGARVRRACLACFLICSTSAMLLCLASFGSVGEAGSAAAAAAAASTACRPSRVPW